MSHLRKAQGGCAAKFLSCFENIFQLHPLKFEDEALRRISATIGSKKQVMTSEIRVFRLTAGNYD